MFVKPQNDVFFSQTLSRFGSISDKKFLLSLPSTYKMHVRMYIYKIA
jgi:hypothetical protein